MDGNKLVEIKVRWSTSKEKQIQEIKNNNF